MFHKITAKKITAYQNHLVNAEKSAATAEKYLRDLRLFLHYLDSPKVDKDAVLAYKAHLTAHYAPASVNSMLSSLNSFFVFQGWCELKLKGLKLQSKFSPAKIKCCPKKNISGCWTRHGKRKTNACFYCCKRFAPLVSVYRNYAISQQRRRGANTLRCNRKGKSARYFCRGNYAAPSSNICGRSISTAAVFSLREAGRRWIAAISGRK